MADLEKDDRAKVLSLIDFLGGFDALKNPPVRDIAKYNLYRLAEADLPDVPAVTLTSGAEEWLTVDFVDLPKAPAPPALLVPYFANQTSLSPSIRPAPVMPHKADGGSASIGSSAEWPVNSLASAVATPEELAQLEQAERWVDESWEPWAVAHDQAMQAKDLYRRLFEQNELVTTDRDSLELVWGFGPLRLNDQGTQVNHPLLTIPVEIAVASTNKQLSVVPSGDLTLETIFLTDVHLDDRNGFNAIIKSIEQVRELDVWDDETLRDLLRQVLRTIDLQGGLQSEIDVTTARAVATSGWVLYLRKRSRDYQGFLNSIKANYEDGAEIPAALRSLVSDSPSTIGDEWAQSSQSQDALLLPLASNQEQQRILRLASTRPGVTVQGPPGTGKSHTIANLISHYVAHGQRVLVVAEKEQALSVLSDKIPEAIRDLSVSVLGTDGDSRARLEASIRRIQQRVSTIEKQYVDSRIAMATNQLDGIDRSIAETTSAMCDSRSRETVTLGGSWPVGPDATPSVVASWLAENENSLSYITDTIDPRANPPLTNAEFVELVNLLQNPGLETAAKATQLLPDPSMVPSGRELTDLLTNLHTARETYSNFVWAVADRSEYERTSPADLEPLRNAMRHEVEWYESSTNNWIAATRVQFADPALRDGWDTFASECADLRNHAIETGRLLEAYSIEVPTAPEPHLQEGLEAAASKFDQKGKLGIRDGKLKSAVNLCKVDGRVPSTSGEVALCITKLNLDNTRKQLRNRWTSRMESVNGPTLDDRLPELAAGQLLGALATLAAEHDRWRVLDVRLTSAGLRCLADRSPETISATLDALEPLEAMHAEATLLDRLASVRNYLENGGMGEDTRRSQYWSVLLEAFAASDVETWASSLDAIHDLADLTEGSNRLIHLLDQLRSSVPIWADQFVNETSVAWHPEQFTEAFEWRQLQTWMDSILGLTNPSQLQQQLHDLQNRRRKTIADLGSEMAWRRLSDHVGDRERQALNSYVQAVKKYGKTGGKFKDRKAREIREALDDCKDAVPVWVMTTNRALASFRPAKVPPFDVLIIDEASQLGLDAIPILSLAASAIVVGDDQQTSPENVGLKREPAFELLEDHLQAVHKYRILFDPDSSLYDLAQQRFPDVVVLTEHFRSLPPIISFSSQLCYDGGIVPLRDQLPSPGWSSLGLITVADGYRKDDINKPEAETIADLISKCCADPAYDDMSFGVVTMLGTAQAKYIWDLLFDDLGPTIMKERQIRCGNAATFQGDERDVIIISLVAATDPENPEGRIGAMTKDSDKRRINVAASRARNQMWVVTSLAPDRFAKGDFRADLIRHCLTPPSAQPSLENLADHCDSEFEVLVLAEILSRGYEGVNVQKEVGRYRIDIVVEGAEARLAVECDGDRWHGEERWHDDRSRQETLERAGWTFVRISGSAFYRNRKAALEPLWHRLDELNIRPGESGFGGTTNVIDRTVRSTELPLREIQPPLTSEVETDSEARATKSEALLEPVAKVASPAPEAVAEPQQLMFGAVESEVAALGYEPAPAPGVQGAVAEVVEVVEHKTADTGVSKGNLQRQKPESILFGRREEDGASEPQRASGPKVQPFSSWVPSRVANLTTALQEDIQECLLEIVAAEGPMLATRAYRLYTGTKFHDRLPVAGRKRLNKALYAAVQSGLLSQLVDDEPGQATKTVYIPTGPSVLVRTAGPRPVREIPMSELQNLLEIVGPASSIHEQQSTAYRLLGLQRLSYEAQVCFDDAGRYRWRTP